MNLYIQWTQQNIADSFQIDHTLWSTLPKRPIPASKQFGGDDDIEGWIMSLVVMGIKFNADHYAVKSIVGGCRVIAWNDDREDDTGLNRSAGITDIYTPTVQNGVMNTRIVKTVYTESNYDSFDVPADDKYVRHGVWVTDNKFDEHEAARSHHGWKEWIE